MLVNNWLGVKKPEPLWDAKLVSDVVDNNTLEDILGGLRRFSERVLRGATKAMFLSDILGWKYGVVGSMMSEVKSNSPAQADELLDFAKLVKNIKENNEDTTT